MKTDPIKTNYYRRTYNTEKKTFENVEIPLNQHNMEIVEIDTIVFTAFTKYGCRLPKYAIVCEIPHFVDVYLFRENIDNKEDMLEWFEKEIYVKDELDRQAQANSSALGDEMDENWIQYKFKII